MKRIVIALLLVLMAGSAFAQSIYDLNTGAVAENDPVQVLNATVTATRYNGFFCQQPPHAEHNGIWVYAGTDLGVVPGDVVSMEGVFVYYYGTAEVNVSGGTVQTVGSGPVPPPAVVPAAVLLINDPLGPWVSSLVTIPDEGVVSALGSYGEWDVDYAAGTLTFDDYWYDADSVAVGDCYQSVTGISYYSFGAPKMEPFVDGIDFCPVPTDETTFGTLKALYR